MTRFLIAGLGSIGRRHLRNLLALGEHDILLYRTHQATLSDDELLGFPSYTDLEEALAQKPDGVIVANPTAAHMSVALPAAAAGAHLLIEKPIAPTLEEIPALAAALEANEKQVLVGFHFRQHPVLKQIKSILDSGELGRVYSAHAHWGEYLPAWHPWEDYRRSYAARKDLGGGVVNTLSHPFDYLRWLLGEAESVSAVTSKQSDLELDTEDHCDATLRFENSALATVHLDYYQRPASHAFSITCAQAAISWDNASGNAMVMRADSSVEELRVPAGFERNTLFLDEMRHFIALCQGGVNSCCSLEDGITAQKIALAVHQSSAKGGCETAIC